MATKAAKKKPETTGDLSENNLPTEDELMKMPESDYMNCLLYTSDAADE